MNLYELLEVSSNASPEVIRMAYKALAKKYHPDGNDPLHSHYYHERMKEINNARDILLDPSKRRRYDEELLKTTRVNYNYSGQSEKQNKSDSESTNKENPEKHEETKSDEDLKKKESSINRDDIKSEEEIRKQEELKWKEKEKWYEEERRKTEAQILIKQKKIRKVIVATSIIIIFYVIINNNWLDLNRSDNSKINNDEVSNIAKKTTTKNSGVKTDVQVNNTNLESTSETSNVKETNNDIQSKPSDNSTLSQSNINHETTESSNSGNEKSTTTQVASENNENATTDESEVETEEPSTAETIIYYAFSIGSDMETVEKVMGAPEEKIGDTWYYGTSGWKRGYSEVYFSSDNKVVGWDQSLDNVLKVDIFLTYKNLGNKEFQNGSTKDEVVSVLGTPDVIIYNPIGETVRETWGFEGFGGVHFSPQGLVISTGQQSPGN